MTNINDAAGVAALLDQLKASPQWQELASELIDNKGRKPQPPESLLNDSRSETQSTPTSIDHTNESVASLLSQLEFPPTFSAHVHIAPVNQTRQVKQNPREISFRAALPILSELAENDSFLSDVKKLREEQNSLERKLWTEREAIYSKYVEKFKMAQTKAQMIGATVSQYEIDAMNNDFKKKIQNFDNVRVMPAWDALVSRQQQELERMRVPAMFNTTVTQDRKRQQEIVDVLETVANLRTT